MIAKERKSKWKQYKDWIWTRGGDLKHHYTLLGRKYLSRKTKPKAEFYEKRGR